MQNLLEENSLSLGLDNLDKNHIEFLELLEKVKSAKKEEFLKLFEEMIKHTKEHFEYEENLMKEKNFYGLSEHREEHTNLLNEMEYFYNKAKKIHQFGLSYINEYAYDKFKRHIINIDSQLAMFLKGQK